MKRRREPEGKYNEVKDTTHITCKMRKNFMILKFSVQGPLIASVEGRLEKS
jgi:hypothetical protein